MAGRAATPQGSKLGNINNMPNRKCLPSINFSVPFARWSHFYVSIDWTINEYSVNCRQILVIMSGLLETDDADLLESDIFKR
jgi:hypothetical protein